MDQVEVVVDLICFVCSSVWCVDVLSEIERNLQDAMNVVRNIISDPRVVPGGGATEMALAASKSFLV